MTDYPNIIAGMQVYANDEPDVIYTIGNFETIDDVEFCDVSWGNGKEESTKYTKWLVNDLIRSKDWLVLY